MENQLVMGSLSFMIKPIAGYGGETDCIWQSKQQRALYASGLPPVSHSAFLMLFSLGQRCSVNINEIEPCL